MNRREFIASATTAAAAAMCKPAIAQPAWPAKGRTIRVVVPWPPGAANDALGRLVAQRLQDKFGATAIVENRTGGSGLIGTKYVIDADPDGYTFLASAFNTAVMPLVLKSADFNPQTDLEVIARTGVAPLICVMTADRPQKTVSEVISAAKADPGNWNFAISAVGSAGHLATIDFLQRTGANIPMVAYRGTQPALLDVMAGAVQLLIDTSFALIPAAKDGTKARALGIAAAKRSVLAPDIPTMTEAGVPGFEFQSWYALWAPKGTPGEITTTVHDLVQEIMHDPKVVDSLKANLLEPVTESTDQTRMFIASEITRAKRLLQSVNFQPA
ncbi:MAG TPA: tripartite tricarboxylate transporter substrate binding protein [Xanthobacteraceae bacterium]|nr:tripartite tricarboxylate transporter substrate binding protein [Xanthobacteraceae bacterium]